MAFTKTQNRLAVPQETQERKSMTTEQLREDICDYEVLENEGVSFVDERRRALRVTALWEKAAGLVDYLSEITIGENHSGRLYVGYHRTLSEMTPMRLVRLGLYVGAWPGLLNLELNGEGNEVYMTFLFPARILRDPMDLKKLLKKADEAVNKAYK